MCLDGGTDFAFCKAYGVVEDSIIFQEAVGLRRELRFLAGVQLAELLKDVCLSSIGWLACREVLRNVASVSVLYSGNESCCKTDLGDLGAVTGAVGSGRHAAALEMNTGDRWQLARDSLWRNAHAKFCKIKAMVGNARGKRNSAFIRLIRQISATIAVTHERLSASPDLRP